MDAYALDTYEVRKRLKYQRRIDELNRRNDAELAMHMDKVQMLFDGARHFVVRQRKPLSRIIMGLISRSPQNPQSREDVKNTSETERFGISAHCNLVGDPGTGKTVICKVLADLIGGSSERIQGRADLEPEDVSGQYVMLEPGRWEFRKGPIFANIVLFDEINRGKPATQSAALEPMAEGQITRDIPLSENTVEKRTVKVPRPFYLIATQNPLEQEGVNPLPEAQLDRFAMQVSMEGLPIEAVKEVMRVTRDVFTKKLVEPVISINDVLACQQFISDKVLITPSAERYAALLAKLLVPYSDLSSEDEEIDAVFKETRRKVRSTLIAVGKEKRYLKDIVAGAMYNRMAIVMQSLAKTQAFLQGRRFVLPEDIRKVFPDCAGHRIFFHARMGGVFNRREVTEQDRRLDHLELSRIVIEHVLRNTPIVFEEAPHAVAAIVA